jgi:hypothetical protein
LRRNASLLLVRGFYDLLFQLSNFVQTDDPAPRYDPRHQGIVRSDMACYHFAIKNSEHTEDLGGMEFANDAAAVAFGNEVILDLAHRAAKQYTGWTMEITEGERALGSHPFKANVGRKR